MLLSYEQFISNDINITSSYILLDSLHISCKLVLSVVITLFFTSPNSYAPVCNSLNKTFIDIAIATYYMYIVTS